MDLVKYREKLEQDITQEDEMYLPKQSENLPDECQIEETIIVTDDGFFLVNQQSYVDLEQKFNLDKLNNVLNTLKKDELTECSEKPWITISTEKYCKKSDVIDVLVLLKKLNISYKHKIS